MTSLASASATDAGKVRSTNQDLALVADDLVAVADGMGGHAGGEIAAAIAVEALRASFEDDPSADGLLAAADEANRAVYERGERDRELRGMGTTLTAAAIVPSRRSEKIALINVGDSRAYLFAEQELTQLTEDHSLVEEMHRRGELTSAQAASHPHRHILTRALGIDPTVEVDSWMLEARPGSRLLLCSDGLTNECGEEEIAAVLGATSDPAEAARILVARALDHGGNDNITVVVADVVGLVTEAPAPPVPAEVAVSSDGAGKAVPLPSEQGLEAPPEVVDPAATTALITSLAPPKRAPRPQRAPRAPRQPRRATRGEAAVRGEHGPRGRLITVRSVAFVLALLAVLGGIIAVVTWFIRASYFIGLDHEAVVIYEGRPGGVLWFKPTVAERTKLTVDQVFAPDRDELRSGILEGSLKDAERAVRNLTDEQRFLGLAPTTTTTTTTLPPTSLAPATTAAATTPKKAH